MSPVLIRTSHFWCFSFSLLWPTTEQQPANLWGAAGNPRLNFEPSCNCTGKTCELVWGNPIWRRRTSVRELVTRGLVHMMWITLQCIVLLSSGPASDVIKDRRRRLARERVIRRSLWCSWYVKRSPSCFLRVSHGVLRVDPSVDIGNVSAIASRLWHISQNLLPRLQRGR